jgi:hypothetical protein
MPLELNAKEVAHRLQGYSRENYLLLANVIKGVVLGTATLSAIHIMADLGNNWQKITPFICSTAAAITSYVTWTRGVLLTNSRSNTRDSVIPLLMGGVEISLFAVLQNDGPFIKPWHFWFSILGLHALLAVWLVKNRLKNTSPEDFAPDLRDFAKAEYEEWMKKDIVAAGKGFVMSSVFFGITCFLWATAGRRLGFLHVGSEWGNWALFILSIPPAFSIGNVARVATRQLEKLDAEVSKQIRAKSPADH